MSQAQQDLQKARELLSDASNTHLLSDAERNNAAVRVQLARSWMELARLQGALDGAGPQDARP